jgi:hypothetical protein
MCLRLWFRTISLMEVNQMWINFITSAILMLSCNSVMQKDQPQRGKLRDLILYESAGPFTVKLDLDAQSRANIEAEIRDFLWRHWHQHRLGHLTATFFSREGEPSTSFYFVEPGEQRSWHIAVKINRRLADRSGSRKQYNQTNEYTAYSVDRIEVPEGGLKVRVVIPVEDLRAPQSYRLVLKDKQGKVLVEI